MSPRDSLSPSVKRASLSFVALLVVLAGTVAVGQGYRKPPKEVLDVLNSPVTPSVFISPARDQMLLATGVRYPPISDLAQPMLRLAGYRINPNTNGPHLAPYFVALSLKRIADGAETKVDLPADARASAPQWSADGKRFAFMNTTPTGIELWVGDASTGRATKIKNVLVNAALGDALQWMPDNRTLLVRLVPSTRARLSPASNVPREPNIQESSGRAGPVRTYQDLLKTPYDEELLDYYATAQLALVDAASGRVTNIGQPAIYDTASPAPDGEHLLVARIQRPYSYLYPADDFPKEVEVWDTKGKLVHKLASQPLQDQVPIDGVPTGPRAHSWRPTEPATLLWIEALDNGDPKKKVAQRDRVLMLKAPFTGAPTELMKLEDRYAGIQWFERGGFAFISDYNRDTRRVRTQFVNVDNTSVAPRVIWHRNVQDRYNDPGQPMTRVLPNGHRAIMQSCRDTAMAETCEEIFLTGTGASPEGDRPFLDRFNIKTQQATRLFRSDPKSYETVIALMRPDGSQFITRRETPIQPSNLFMRMLGSGVGGASAGEAAFVSASQPLTNFPDPTPQLRDIKKQLVTYKRADGVQLSFTLYLPPGYKEGTRLPTVVWAYPLEFNDAATAGQVSGSTQRFTTIGGPSHLFFLLEGYAVLDNATMPVVGDPETVNNTYVEQIVSSAKAAIDKAAEMGVTDPERVGVGGHSYGAFMTGNLLAHSDLFRAGIARSGAYNRTLTPFGFQSERRILWEAPDMYIKVSPFMNAHKIKEPLLLIHGEADNNTGTFPIQSERMYQAIRGTGGTVRLVMLPLESHGYAARETTEHVLYEMLNWFDKYVKNAPPRRAEEKASTAASQ
ncbi:MAG TPA: prolyl oligopeptidase family serine peptidase [Pyrinomonadaceae bacterium]|nr:prolyl oligopeptidase family serine peptidase [Pyrinomonadaceae bacterium]